MQNAEVVLTMLSQQSNQNSAFVFDRLYRNLFNPDFYLLAYSNIYAKEGNMTEGIDGKTIDGFNTKKVEEIISLLRQERYYPKPVRRAYIPKKNGKLRPLASLPSGTSWYKKCYGSCCRQCMNQSLRTLLTVSGLNGVVTRHWFS